MKIAPRIAFAAGIMVLTVWWIASGKRGLEVGDEVTFGDDDDRDVGERFAVVKTVFMVPRTRNIKPDSKYVQVCQLTGTKKGKLSWRLRAFVRKVRPN